MMQKERADDRIESVGQRRGKDVVLKELDVRFGAASFLSSELNCPRTEIAGSDFNRQSAPLSAMPECDRNIAAAGGNV